MMRVNVFRIPSMLPLPPTSGGKGVVLAFAEARPDLHDAGVSDLVMRRSTDSGATWSPARAIVTGSMLGQANRATVGNPTGGARGGCQTPEPGVRAGASSAGC